MIIVGIVLLGALLAGLALWRKPQQGGVGDTVLYCDQCRKYTVHRKNMYGVYRCMGDKK